MKRDTRQKSSLFLRKRTAFLSGISLHFRPFVVRYGFRILKFHNWTYFIQQRLRGLSFIYSQDRLTIILGDLYQGHVFSLSYKQVRVRAARTVATPHMCAAATLPHIRAAVAHVRRAAALKSGYTEWAKDKSSCALTGYMLAVAL